MWPYVVLILFPIISQHVTIGYRKRLEGLQRKKSELTMRLFWFFFFILLIFRHESVGIDLANYKTIFKFISDSNWRVALGRSSEIAWSFMNKLISMLGGDFRWVLIVSAFLSVFWMARAYIKYLQDVSLTISLFIILTNFILLFSGLRQAIAISLGFLAFEFVRNKKLIFFGYIC